jgi:hypothetical protein
VSEFQWFDYSIRVSYDTRIGARVMGGCQGGLQLAQAVGTALDIEHMTAVQQAVEDGGGEDFVTGEDLWPGSRCPCWW